MNNVKFISYFPDWNQYGIVEGNLCVPDQSPILYTFYSREEARQHAPSSFKDILVSSEANIFVIYAHYIIINPFNEEQASNYFATIGYPNVQFEYSTMEDFRQNFEC